MIKTYSPKNGQSNYDVCLITYGGLDNFVKLLNDNNLATGLSSPSISIGYNYDTQKIINRLFVNKDYNTSNTLLQPLLNNDGTPLLNNDGTPLFNNF